MLVGEEELLMDINRSDDDGGGILDRGCGLEREYRETVYDVFISVKFDIKVVDLDDNALLVALHKSVLSLLLLIIYCLFVSSNLQSWMFFYDTYYKIFYFISEVLFIF